MFRLSRTVHWSSRPSGCFCLQCGDRQPAEGQFFFCFRRLWLQMCYGLTSHCFVMIRGWSSPFLLVVDIPTVRIPYESREGHSPYSDFWLYLDYKSNDFDRCVSFIEVIFDALVGGHQPFQIITELTISKRPTFEKQKLADKNAIQKWTGLSYPWFPHLFAAASTGRTLGCGHPLPLESQ